MEVRVGTKDCPRVGSPEETVARVQADLIRRLPAWCQRLREDPAGLRDIEEEIDQACRHGGGLVVAALLAQVTGEEAMERRVEAIREQAARPLRKPERRESRVRLLCGLVLWITTWYCGPRLRGGHGRSREGSGLYPELAALGFGKGCSPALQSRVARAVALCPSMELARQELLREGVELDEKTVRRMALQLGVQCLTVRKRELSNWRNGNVPSGASLAGRRVVVQIDGGRVRIRTNQPRRGRGKGRRPKFKAEWREPKLLIIYEIDQKGHMVKGSRAVLDGTLQGPDHLAELAAYHLHGLGAAKAENVTFVADGAPWIWDRLNWIERRVGLDSSRTTHVLDFCHAAHHVSLALMALGLNEEERKRRYGELRRQLRKGQYEQVVQRLESMAQDVSTDSDVFREIRYLRTHGDAGHLRYPTFRRRGFPLGSGAIESSVRRVINLRLKGNAIDWADEGAEALLVLRAALLTDRWEESLAKVQASMLHDRHVDWRWEAPHLSTRHMKVTNATNGNGDDTP
jgi:hypothetical protein